MMRRKPLPPFAALRAFEAVGRVGSVRKAAADLSIHPSAVSRHVRGLEAWLGAPLFEPAAAAMRLTPAGARLHREIGAAIDRIADAAEQFMRQGGPADLSVWANGGFAAKWLGRELLTFGETLPPIAIELRPSDASPDLARDEADIDIRFYGDGYTQRPSQGALRSEEIARPPIFAVAAPGYAARRGVDSIAALMAAPLLHEENDEQWRSWLGRWLAVPAEPLPGPRLWHAHIALDAAARGEGFALASNLLAADDLREGRLERCEIGGTAPAAELGSYLFTTRADRWTRPAVARLRDWLIERLADDVDLKATPAAD